MKRSLCAALFLAVSMAVVVGIPAYRASPAYQLKVLEATIQAEIRAEEEKVFADVRRQLEAQGKLDMMETYEEILRPDIENGVRAKYQYQIAQLEQHG